MLPVPFQSVQEYIFHIFSIGLCYKYKELNLMAERAQLSLQQHLSVLTSNSIPNSIHFGGGRGNKANGKVLRREGIQVLRKVFPNQNNPAKTIPLSVCF